MSNQKDPYAPLGDKLNQAPTHWRSFEHKDGALTHSEKFDEFPQGISEPEAAGVRRRDVLKMAGAASLLTAVACVRRPEEEILPFTKAPEQLIPGVRLMYATAMPRAEGAVGLIVESHTGRPTKIEGNPKHPSSLGSSDVWAQAEVVRLYDPDRARGPLQGGKQVGWDVWDTFANDHFGKLKAAGGAGLAFLVEDDHSPTVARMLTVARASFPQAKFYRWDPLASDGATAAAELAFGPGARVHRDLTNVQTILSLDSNWLIEGPDHLRHSRQYAKRRALLTAQDAAKMNRLYVAEGVFSSTGSNADHRVRLASGEGLSLLRAIAGELASKHGLALGELAQGGKAPEGTEKFVAAVAKDLASAKGNVALFVGERQPAAVQALGLALETALGAGGTGALSVSRAAEPTASRSGIEQLSELVAGLNAGSVQTLVVLDANPVYTAPGALGFADALAKAQTVIHGSVLPEETAAKAHWHLPTTHFLESWGDAVAWDGTVSIVQPLIFPIFGARPTSSLLAQLTGHPEKADRKLVEETHRGTGAALADARAWMTALTDGLVASSTRALTPAPAVNAAAIASALGSVKSVAPSRDALELVALNGQLQDGRLSNVSWLMELPDSMTKLSWDNAVLMSPALAHELEIGSKVSDNSYQADLVELTAGGRSIQAPVFVLPGLAKHTLAIARGYGRTTGGVASGIGVSVNPILVDATGVVQGVTLKKTGKTVGLCSTQDHFSVPADPFKQMTFVQMAAIQGPDRTLGLGTRPLLRSGEADQVAKGDFSFASEGAIPANLVQLKTPNDDRARPSTPIQPHSAVHYAGQQWGMAIDLSTCIGCNACAVACIAENNIPTVGREQVLLGRELHWLRVDRYYQGDIDNPTAAHQPVPCMHCENAPCEPVCPVAATVHDDEGLNTMAYNRCIGTRYCNNNCPYKVRRFNYLDYSKTGDLHVDAESKERWKSLKMQRNPDVTVRYRGVMEKCTYCTQRIDEAKIAAKRAGLDRNALPDGAVVPACAQACPTHAISFGNINDPKSRVHQLKVSPRNYEMLQELNTRPRTTYLARVKNENEELA